MFKVSVELIAKANEILRTFPQIAKPDRQIPVADPFIVALAFIENNPDQTRLPDSITECMYCRHAGAQSAQDW